MKKFIFYAFLFWSLIIPLAIIAWIKQPFTFNHTHRQIPKVDTEQLKKDVETLSTTYAGRNFWDVSSLNQAADYIEQQFSESTQNIKRQSYTVEGEQFHNIIATFGATEGNPIIIGAHYDAFEKTAGADDNASGVAGLLALAKMFKAHPPKVPVQLIAYTLEEPPNFRTDAMGSRHHAKWLVENNIKPELVVVLEMIGYFSDQPNSQEYPIEQLKWLYPNTGNFIAVVGHLIGTSEVRLVKSAMQSAANLPVQSINAPSLLAGVDFSDHASYWDYDIPAVMVTDTSFYRNKNYHKPTDTAEKLDYQRMAQVVQGVFAVANKKNKD